MEATRDEERASLSIQMPSARLRCHHSLASSERAHHYFRSRSDIAATYVQKRKDRRPGRETAIGRAKTAAYRNHRRRLVAIRMRVGLRMACLASSWIARAWPASRSLLCHGCHCLQLIQLMQFVRERAAEASCLKTNSARNTLSASECPSIQVFKCVI